MILIMPKPQLQPPLKLPVICLRARHRHLIAYRLSHADQHTLLVEFFGDGVKVEG